ncbi:hypothetical protein [Anabaena sp. UHCC 0253]|nr:hypothetical protein [Anabaena sp. UHCC 0253]
MVTYMLLIVNKFLTINEFVLEKTLPNFTNKLDLNQGFPQPK